MRREVARPSLVAVIGGVVVAVSLLLAACSSPSRSGAGAAASASELNDHNANSTFSGLGLDPAQPRPNFTLTESGTGKAFSFGTATAGKPTLLYFGYTNCPDVCPTTMADIAVALSKVPAKVRDETQVVFVTTDVKRDSGDVLARYLAKFDTGLGNKFIGLYGTQNAIDAAQVAAHVTLAEDEGQQHSAEVLLYGSDDYARVAFLQSDNEQDVIAHDLPLVAG
jgi:protein SCO1/2